MQRDHTWTLCSGKGCKENMFRKRKQSDHVQENSRTLGAGISLRTRLSYILSLNQIIKTYTCKEYHLVLFDFVYALI